jgi:hypothetical protein
MANMFSERGCLGLLFYLCKRVLVGIFALLLILAALVGSFGLVGVGVVMRLAERDFSLSSETFRYWPENFPTIELFYSQNVFFMVSGALLLFIGLPLLLTVLEQFFVWTEPPRS